MSNDIVSQIDGELLVSSEMISARTEKDHASILRTINDYMGDFEQFGQVRFEIRPGYNNSQVRIAMLNEHQATLLMTFMRNIGPVKAFKLELVKQFYAMRHALIEVQSKPLTRSELARMVLESESENEALTNQLVTQKPIVEYHERFIAEKNDLVTVENFASQYGTTEPKVRVLLKEKNVAVRRLIGQRWSKSKQRMVDEHEWRARQGVASAEWFDLLPQHNAPRLHNGQVRQTLYVRQYFAEALALKLGLVVSRDLGSVSKEVAA